MRIFRDVLIAFLPYCARGVTSDPVLLRVGAIIVSIGVTSGTSIDDTRQEQVSQTTSPTRLSLCGFFVLDKRTCLIFTSTLNAQCFSFEGEHSLSWIGHSSLLHFRRNLWPGGLCKPAFAVECPSKACNISTLNCWRIFLWTNIYLAIWMITFLFLDRLFTVVCSWGIVKLSNKKRSSQKKNLAKSF